MDNLTQATSQVNTLTQAKRKLDQTINSLQEEAEDLENEAKNADDRAKKAAMEVLLSLCRLLTQIRALAWLPRTEVYLRYLSLCTFILMIVHVPEVAELACARELSFVRAPDLY